MLTSLRLSRCRLENPRKEFLLRYRETASGARGRLSVFMRRFLSESPLRGRMKCDLAVPYSIFIVIDKFGESCVECQLIESLIDRKLSSSHVTA